MIWIFVDSILSFLNKIELFQRTITLLTEINPTMSRPTTRSMTRALQAQRDQEIALAKAEEDFKTMLQMPVISTTNSKEFVRVLHQLASTNGAPTRLRHCSVTIHLVTLHFHR